MSIHFECDWKRNLFLHQPMIQSELPSPSSSSTSFTIIHHHSIIIIIQYLFHQISSNLITIKSLILFYFFSRSLSLSQIKWFHWIIFFFCFSVFFWLNQYETILLLYLCNDNLIGTIIIVKYCLDQNLKNRSGAGGNFETKKKRKEKLAKIYRRFDHFEFMI